MNITPEQLNEAKKAKSAEELFAMAKENGMALTEEEAKAFFTELNRSGELADDELDNVSGGCGGKSEEAPPTYDGYELRKSGWAACGEFSCCVQCSLCQHFVKLSEDCKIEGYDGYCKQHHT